jgi:thiamine-phosphate pyrophosphorylase
MQLRRVLPSFYPVVDTAVCAARSMDPAALAAACLRGGARLIQLRHKSAGSAAFLSLARTFAALAAAHDAWLVVNDRADIARLAGAAGVHVGQQDLPVAAVRRLLGEDAIIGLSTHGPAQVDEALGLAVTYVAVGPIFGTTTKETGYEARGLSLIEYAAGRGKPVVAIGGLTLDRVRATIAAGASAVAVIGDLFEGGDPEARTREYLAELVLAGASRD